MERSLFIFFEGDSMKFLKSIICCLFILFSSCLKAENSVKQSDDAAMPAQILYHINKYRNSRGLNSLKMDAVISEEARKHSQDMATHRLGFGHQYFSDRIKHIYARLPLCRGGAENVAYNYRNAEHVVQEWIKSRGHKQNIIGTYNLTGIGIARDEKGKIYFTQMFIRN